MTRRHALTDAQVSAVRAKHRPGVRGFGYASLALQYGVGESTIRDVVKHRTAYGVRVLVNAPAEVPHD